MIWIRADANEEIGTGHVMRCLSIADALRRRGQRPCFITADERAVPVLERGGQEYRILHSDYRNMEDELPGLLDLIAGGKPDFFLADSYFVTPRYLREVRRSVPAGFLDDLARTDVAADLLVNYNIFADASLYGATDGAAAGGANSVGEADGAAGVANSAGAETAGFAGASSAGGAAVCGKYLLGTEYVPLRGEFRGVEYSVRERAETVLVTTGGSDKYNLAGQLLKKALADPHAAELRYLVVSGAYNVHLPELMELEGRHANVHICCNVNNMSELMRESDIAVSAGGSTMYELSAVGVPVICISFVDNQERIVRGFVEKGLACFGGNYLAQGEAVLDGAVSGINRLAADPALRRDYSARLRALVDGKGAERIAEWLCGHR